jgi:hypothetical protein
MVNTIYILTFLPIIVTPHGEPIKPVSILIENGHFRTLFARRNSKGLLIEVKTTRNELPVYGTPSTPFTGTKMLTE